MAAMKSGISWVAPIESEIFRMNPVVFCCFNLVQSKLTPPGKRRKKNNTRKEGFHRYFRKWLFTSESHVPSLDLGQSGHSLMLRTPRERLQPFPVLLLLTNITFYPEPTQRIVCYQKMIGFEFLFTPFAPFLASCSVHANGHTRRTRTPLSMGPAVQHTTLPPTPVYLRDSRWTSKTDWE